MKQPDFQTIERKFKVYETELSTLKECMLRIIAEHQNELDQSQIDPITAFLIPHSETITIRNSTQIIRLETIRPIRIEKFIVVLKRVLKKEFTFGPINSLLVISKLINQKLKEINKEQIALLGGFSDDDLNDTLADQKKPDPKGTGPFGLNLGIFQKKKSKDNSK